MAKAPQQEQHRLLDLQAFDSRLQALKRRAAELAQDPGVAAAAAIGATLRAELAEADAAQEEARAALAASEQEVERVQARIEKDRKQLESGFGDSKSLMGLQHELETLAARKSELEDAELELMEALEEVGAAREQAAAASAQADAALAAEEARRDSELEAVGAERGEVQSGRDALSAELDPGLLALYEKRLAQRGIGAARLYHGASEGSGMKLAPGDLAEIKAAADDDVVYCPDSGCILVRSADWN
ncbi:zinc ribbon domain-containing protein [Zafaria sp. J156]|uniref:zinc ribbon domain-containing protein n=1 Tax=Zafaria sp. J156 TaxID=3116490 RepID=UPI002E78120E|nr:C4-type zinc ribbon domain-containing protein [Zafaria sp. J156]MEE1620666.1 C4-type zinc ribbon domain-containing protein [Zafaria sp. J156]